VKRDVFGPVSVSSTGSAVVSVELDTSTRAVSATSGSAFRSRSTRVSSIESAQEYTGSSIVTRPSWQGWRPSPKSPSVSKW
jgi:hypothetical protein